MKENVILSIGTYHIIVNIDEVPFFDELTKTNKGIIIDDDPFTIYKASSLEVAAKIDRLLTEDFRNHHNNFVLDINLDNKKYYSKGKINKNYVFNNGCFLNFHNNNKGYNFTIYDENKYFITGGTINFYENQKHDDDSIIKDIADFSGFKFLLGNKQRIESIDYDNIKI